MLRSVRIFGENFSFKNFFTGGFVWVIKVVVSIFPKWVLVSINFVFPLSHVSDKMTLLAGCPFSSLVISSIIRIESK